jgi:small-conductance mechanosensitive channel
VTWCDQICAAIPRLLSALAIIALVIGSLWVANWFLLRRTSDMGEDRRFSRRVAMLVLTLLGIVTIVLLVPVEETTRPHLLTLLGLALTAVIALGSTTFVANAMAGLMLRTVRAFRPGDFVQVGDHFGRVTERGLFHTEIQTEDRDLTTLPNLYLVTNPVKVVSYSGTVVSATVSLGYDLPKKEIRALLIEAAKAADLEDPFVQILELGDFSITYRVAGFLAEVKQLLTARSNLRSSMLDTLHEADVEIVSPTFMNQRRLGERDRAIPPKIDTAPSPKDDVPEDLIFDKAEEAQRHDDLQVEHDGLLEEIGELKKILKKADKAARARLEAEIEQKQQRADQIAEEIEKEAEKDESSRGG